MCLLCVLGIFDGVDLSHLQRAGKKPRQDELQHQKRACVAVELLSIKRTLKPLADAQETQRRERVQLLGDAAEALAIPRSYVQAPPRPAAASLFHKPNYQLQALRSDIPLPAQSTIQQYRLQQAPLDSTETRTFITQQTARRSRPERAVPCSGMSFVALRRLALWMIQCKTIEKKRDRNEGDGGGSVRRRLRARGTRWNLVATCISVVWCWAEPWRSASRPRWVMASPASSPWPLIFAAQ